MAEASTTRTEAQGSRTGPLRKAIARMPDRPFAIQLWDGTRVKGTRPGPTLTLTDPAAVGRILRSPGELGLGRAYATGELEVDDLDGIIALLGRWKPEGMGLGAKLRMLAAALWAAPSLRWKGAPPSELQPRGSAHTRERDADAVRHHYDVSNDLFSLFLDESMTYSCALFEGAATLEEAQRVKLDVICQKLALEPGMRFCDVGCGWGSLVIHAAREYGVEATGITLSPEQASLATQRIAEAGLSKTAQAKVMDYRDLPGQGFDAIASIGMVEHVGEVNIDPYAASLANAITPEGRVLNHGIIRVPPEKDGVHKGGDFSNRYVFPDGELLNLSRTVLAFERAGLEIQHVENLHANYAETLRHWSNRLDENLDEAERIVGPERLRVWRLYLRAARNGFETGSTAVCQTVCTYPLTEPYTAEPIGLDQSAPRRPQATAGDSV